MKQMAKYLDKCKTNGIPCQCTGVLMPDPTNPDINKTWSFLFQCNQTPKSVDSVQDLTKKLIANPYEPTYYRIKKN
jgi:hypothetical protein